MEQHVELALRYVDRVYVLFHGQVVLQGQAVDLHADRPLLEKSYLVGGWEAARDEGAG